MNKRERVLSVLDQTSPQTYVPGGFFVHFDPYYHEAEAAIEKHLEFFHTTGMDFVKVQFETVFPPQNLRAPEDWASVEAFPASLFDGLLQAVEGLVAAVRNEALVLVTLYSPFMCTGHLAKGHPEGSSLLTRHLQQDPQAVEVALSVMTDTLGRFVDACIAIGVDGFYTSTQGGEQNRFEDPEVFTRFIKPWDLELMNRARSCAFNILHICDYHDGYASLEQFLDYPGQVVNCSLQVGETKLTPTEISELFGRPFMGGLDRHGKLATGTADDIHIEVTRLLESKSEKFLLGADCTLPSDVDWQNLRVALEVAHEYL